MHPFFDIFLPIDLLFAKLYRGSSRYANSVYATFLKVLLEFNLCEFHVGKYKGFSRYASSIYVTTSSIYGTTL